MDVVCRYGGEEFGILLTQVNASQALGVAEKLRKLVEGWQFPGVPRTVTISAGAAALPEHGTTRDELVKAADSALYAAKQAGRNAVCLAPIQLSCLTHCHTAVRSPATLLASAGAGAPFPAAVSGDSFPAPP